VGPGDPGPPGIRLCKIGNILKGWSSEIFFKKMVLIYIVNVINGYRIVLIALDNS
jgi:hypothetical protein